MAPKTIKTTLTILGCMGVLVAGAYVFRENLLRVGINSVLTGDTTVTKLQGVQLGATHAAINQLELHLGASGQQLIVADIDVDFRLQGLFMTPVVQSLSIASARLTKGPDLAELAPDASSDSAASPQGTELLLSDVLQQLRDFPIARIELSDVEVPQFKQKLALRAEQQAESLELRIASGTLQLLANFAQADADTTAQVMLSLDAAGTTVAELELTLQPQASGYRLVGSGKVEFSDVNTPFAEYLTTPLPFSSIAVALDIAADVTDELLNDPADSISLGILPDSTVVLRPGLVSSLGELAVVFTERAELSLVPGAEISVSTGKVPLSLAGSWQQEALQSSVTLTAIACQLSGARDCTIGFDGSVALAAYTVAVADPAAATTISALEFAGNGSAQVTSELVAVTLNPGARLGSGAITGSTFSVTSVSAVSDSVLEVNSEFAEQQLAITAEQISLTLAELKVGEYRVSSDFSLRDISLVSAEKLAGKIRVQTPVLSVTGPQWVPAVGFDADISIDGDMLAFSTPLLLQNALADAQLQLSGSYELAAGTGSINMKLPALEFTGTGNSLSSYLRGWPYPADVMTGTLALDLDVQLQPNLVVIDSAEVDRAMAITASTKLVLTDVAGFYTENFFRGLHTTIEAVYDSSALSLPVTTPPLSLTVDELNVGVPITDVALNYQFDASSHIVNVSSIFGKLLDGTISATDLSYDFSKERNDMTFGFSGLRLDHMLELAEYQGIEAIGAVSGELPVSIIDGKVKVDAGKLYADAPGGSIRYLDAPPAGQGNPAMDLVNQALSNYQFESLESSIDYSPDGELLLGMQLRGHNPDMNGGQAINLNLNISDNIPTLLKSLRAGRVIEEFLQEQYK